MTQTKLFCILKITWQRHIFCRHETVNTEQERDSLAEWRQPRKIPRSLRKPTSEAHEVQLLPHSQQPLLLCLTSAVIGLPFTSCAGGREYTLNIRSTMSYDAQSPTDPANLLAQETARTCPYLRFILVHQTRGLIWPAQVVLFKCLFFLLPLRWSQECLSNILCPTVLYNPSKTMFLECSLNS